MPSSATSRIASKLKHMLFNNATEKIGGTTLLYETIPVDTIDTPGVDEPPAGAPWSDFVSGEAEIVRAKSILAGTHNCMEGI